MIKRMLDESEAAELRALQAKAYGVGGGLSADELARLQELEARGKAPLAEPASSPTELAPLAEPAPTAAPVLVVERAEGETKRAEPVEASAPRHRWPVVIGAATAALAIGWGIGWGIWGWDSAAAALASAHAEQREQFEADGDYDPGTVTPVAEQHGVVVWRADRSNGEQVCVIITSPAQTQSGCVTQQNLKDSVWANTAIAVPDGQEKAGQQLTAALIPTPTGELVPFIQVWGMEQNGWESQYNDSELAQVRVVEAAGYAPEALAVIGYDGDTVIWGTWESGSLCILAPADDGIIETCAEDPDATVTFTTNVDGIGTKYVITQSERRSPQLTVYKDVDVSDYFGTGEQNPAEIDDKTGE